MGEARRHRGTRNGSGYRSRRGWSLLLLLIAWWIALGAVRWERDRFTQWVRARLEDSLSSAVGGTVRIRSLDLRPFRLQARLSGVFLTIPAPGAPALTASADSVVVGLDAVGIAALSTGSVRLDELVVVRPRLALSRKFLDLRRRRREEPRPLEIRIGRLEVREGTFRYGEADVPLEFRARDVRARGTWGVFRRAMIGELRFHAEVARAPLARPYPMEVRSGFRLRGDRLDLFDLRVDGPGIEGSLSVHVRWNGGVELTGGGPVRADLDRVASYLEPDFPRVAGGATWDLLLDRHGGSLRLSGKARAERARFAPIEARRAEADVLFRPGELTLERIHAAAYGGTVRGRVVVDLSGPAAFRTRLHGEGLDAGAIFRMVGRPLPFAARVRADMNLAGRAENMRSWRGEASFRAEPFAAATGALPARAIGTLRISEGRLQMSGADVETSGADLRLDLDLDLADPELGGEVRVKGTTRSARGTQEGMLVLLDALDVDPGDLLRRPLEGAGGLEVRVVLGLEPEVDAALDLRSGAWLDEPFLQARLHANVRGGLVRLREVSVKGEGYRLAGAMNLDLESGRLLRLEGEVKDLDAGRLVSLLGAPVELAGSLTGNGSLHEAEGGLRGDLHLLLRDGTVVGEPVERAEGSLEFAGRTVSLSGATISGPALEAGVEGTYDIRTRSGTFRLMDSTLRLGAVEALRRFGVAVEGEFHVEGPFRVEPEGLTGRLAVRGEPLRIAGRVLGRPGGALRLRKGRVELDLGTRADEETRGWRLTATVGTTADLPVDAVLEVRDGEVTLEGQGAPPGRLRAAGRFHLQGALARPERLHLDGTVQRAEIHVATHSLSASTPFAVELDNGRLVIGPVEIEGAGHRLHTRLEFHPDTGHLGGSLRGELDLGIVNALLPGVRCVGALQMDLSLGGTATAPELHGVATIEDGRLRMTELRQDVEQVRGEIRLLGDELEVVRLHGVTGGGEITMNGGAVLGPAGLDSYRLEVTVGDVRVTYPAGFRGVYRGNLLVRGDLDAAGVDGNLDVVHGLYRRPFESATFLGGGTREFTPEPEPLLPVKLFLDVHLHSDGDVWVRNDLARLESRFDLDLGGTLSRPELTGRLWIFEGGRIQFRDVEYRVESGSLDFVELDRINPYLDLRARTQVGGYDVRLHVEGTADRFNYELTSDPSLPTQDIIALLMTGRMLEEGTRGTPRGSGSRGFTGNMAASYFAGALTGRFEKTLRRTLGLERVWIDPLLVGEAADPTARVTLGKEISDDVTLVYSTDLGTNERQIYRLEWQVSPRFRVTTERDTTGGVGGDLKFFGRLGYGGKRNAPRGRRAASAKAEGTVRRVEITGLPEAEVRSLRKRLAVRPGRPYRRLDALGAVDTLRRFLVDQGRVEARVSMEETRAGEKRDAIAVRYRVEPGPEVNVEIRGVSGKEARRVRGWLLDEWREMMLTDDLYEDGRQALLRHYHDHGYYAADVALEPGPVEDGTRTVVYTLDPGRPVTVRSLAFTGTKAISEARARRQMLTRPPALFSTSRLNPAILKEDLAAVRSLYREEGYLAARIGPPEIRLSADGAAADITIPVDEGPRYTLASVLFRGNVPLDVDTLGGRLGLRKGESFSPSRVAKAEGTLRGALDAAGYPEARVSSRVTRKGTTVTVEFQVEPGSRKVVGEIRIEGNTRTKSGIIRREMLLHRGEPISRDRLLRTQHALYRLGIFREVRIRYAPLSGGDPGAQTLVVRVQEAPPLSFTVAAGYDTEAGARGGFTLTHANVGGRDRTLSFQARASSLERRLQVVGEEPRLFNRDLHAFASVGLSREERPAFTERNRSFAFRVEKSFRPAWKGFFRYNFQRVDLSDVTDEQAVLEEKLENLRLADVGYTIRRDTRDDPFRPTRGGWASADLRVFGGPLPSDADFVKLLVQGSLVKQLGSDQDYAVGLRLGLAAPYRATTRVPLTERFFAGGDSTLRGFPRDGAGPKDTLGRPIGGEALILLNQEWRFPIRGSLRGVLFHDAGNVFLKPADVDPGDFRNVLGFGLRLETPIGPLRLEYGRKVHRRIGESAGEIYLSIGSAF